MVVVRYSIMDNFLLFLSINLLDPVFNPRTNTYLARLICKLNLYPAALLVLSLPTIYLHKGQHTMKSTLSSWVILAEILYSTHQCVQPRKRKQRELFHLWFDPTADFHTYSILWNPQRTFLLMILQLENLKTLKRLVFPSQRTNP